MHFRYNCIRLIKTVCLMVITIYLVVTTARLIAITVALCLFFTTVCLIITTACMSDKYETKSNYAFRVKFNIVRNLK